MADSSDDNANGFILLFYMIVLTLIVIILFIAFTINGAIIIWNLTRKAWLSILWILVNLSYAGVFYYYNFVVITAAKSFVFVGTTYYLIALGLIIGIAIYYISKNSEQFDDANEQTFETIDKNENGIHIPFWLKLFGFAFIIKSSYNAGRKIGKTIL